VWDVTKAKRQEHGRLLNRWEELRAEHEALTQKPFDKADNAACALAPAVLSIALTRRGIAGISIGDPGSTIGRDMRSSRTRFFA
jgi:hypothetical protein